MKGTKMSKRTKIYVKSGEASAVMVADGPMDACLKTLDGFSSGRVLDSDFFFLDPRGFREGDDAQYKVPVEQVLAEAGYIYEDPESHDD